MCCLWDSLPHSQVWSFACYTTHTRFGRLPGFLWQSITASFYESAQLNNKSLQSQASAPEYTASQLRLVKTLMESSLSSASKLQYPAWRLLLFYDYAPERSKPPSSCSPAALGLFTRSRGTQKEVRCVSKNINHVLLPRRYSNPYGFVMTQYPPAVLHAS